MKEKFFPFAVFGSFGILAFVLLIGLIGTLGVEEVALPDTATAATTSAVSVTAEVTTELSCSASAGSTDFGTLSSGSITTATTQASTTMACANAASGCTLYVKDAGDTSNGGLFKSPDLIESPNAAFAASTTLAAGTEGYGIQATSTVAGGSGASLTLGARYSVIADDVGGLTVTNQTLASASATTTGQEVIVDHKAAISATTPGGSYTDTITYECTAI
ncbi:MAG: hypothetical protein Q8P74_00670 [bacterium]|nr:hypothetical protein [bacterium]